MVRDRAGLNRASADRSRWRGTDCHQSEAFGGTHASTNCMLLRLSCSLLVVNGTAAAVGINHPRDDSLPNQMTCPVRIHRTGSSPVTRQQTSTEHCRWLHRILVSPIAMRSPCWLSAKICLALSIRLESSLQPIRRLLGHLR